ncbi:hypothetical protein BOTBODRAFT_92577, partial [Botryobasidium botryosum FD-172 SS1]
GDTQRLFGKRPCMPQVMACEWQLKRRHLICVMPTGSGKTLIFWMPLIWRKSGITLLISPLQSLGDQHKAAAELDTLGITSIHLTSETATDEVFKKIAREEYQVIITSPETINSDPRFDELWENPSFCKKVDRIIFDEAHCISEWGDFRPDYRKLCRLIYICLNAIFLLASATMPSAVLKDVKYCLHLPERTITIFLSNDRPNISLDVRPILHSQKSLFDVAFLIPSGMTVDSPPPRKFMLFMNTKALCESAAKMLRKRLPPALRCRVVWVHADMSRGFVRRMLEALKTGEIYGVCCTDTAGMGIDNPDIALVVQYQAAKSLCVLMQRFGRGARDPRLKAAAILFIEPKHLVWFQDEKKKRKSKKSLTKSGKGVDKRL